MNQSLFKVAKMDCPAEENLVRLQLQGLRGIHKLNFDLNERTVTVLHEGELDAISSAIHTLDLDETLLATEFVNADGTVSFVSSEDDARDASQRKVLWAVLLINFAFFGIEMGFGALSGSMGLVADSLDMLADATVYALSLFAVGAAMSRKKAVAKISGYFQLSLAVIGFVEVARRFVGGEAAPDFRVMIIVSLLALAANAICLVLLQRSQSREPHIQASMIFTSNDVVINLGVIVAGLLVLWLHSPVPDLVIGAAVFVIVMRGALRILKLARP
jgi:Co/Zn/Cd efflux system component/copper chaperone CopZ